MDVTRCFSSGASAAAIIILCGCASSSWFAAGPRPDSLIGSWVDSSLSTPTDTVVWLLGRNGVDKRLHITITTNSAGRSEVRRSVRTNGLWYATGENEQTSSGSLCLKRRSRDGASCMKFELLAPGTAQTGISRRRLVLWFGDAAQPARKVLVERL